MAAVDIGHLPAVVERPRQLGSLVSIATPIPLYHQIATLLRRRIGDAEYPAGSLLPSEDELCAQFQVSRATVRQAVGELVQEGLVSRRRGSGTLVLAGANLSLGQRFHGSLEELMGEMTRVRAPEVEVQRDADFPPRVAALLRLPDGGRGTIVRRTRAMDGQVFAYTVNYLPAQFGARVSEHELRTESLMWLLQRKGVRLVEAVQSIKAHMAEIEVSERLGIALGAPVLFVERLVYGPRRVPVELVRTWYRGDLYEYTVTFDRRRRGPSNPPHDAG